MVSVALLLAALVIIPLTLRISKRAASRRHQAGGRLQWHGIRWDATAPEGDHEQLVEKAIARQRDGDLVGALTLYDRAVAQKRSALALNNRACARLEIGEVDKAIEDLKEALTAEPRNATAHCTLAEAYCRAGNAALALVSLKSAAAIDPAWREHARTARELAPLRALEEGRAWLAST